MNSGLEGLLGDMWVFATMERPHTDTYTQTHTSSFYPYIEKNYMSTQSSPTINCHPCNKFSSYCFADDVNKELTKQAHAVNVKTLTINKKGEEKAYIIAQSESRLWHP